MTNPLLRSDPSLPSRAEFIAIVAMLAGTIAFSIDAMLPALPDIAETTGATDNREQFVITSFVLGTGIGTLFSGPLSDTFGRRWTVIGGAIIYCIAALVAAFSESLELILIARLVQGLGAAGPRVAALSIVRDLYSGREMAKIVSIVMIVFALVPTFAPSIGALIAWATSWHGIFVSFAVFSIISVVWMVLRLPETLPPERRRPLSIAAIIDGTLQVLRNRVVFLAIVVQSLVFGTLFGALSAAQPMFDQAYGQGHTFHLWFGVIALFSASGGFLNALIVEKFGMRRVVMAATLWLAFISAVYLTVLGTGALTGDWAFGGYVIWQFFVFLNAGLTIGNLNALGMEPVGHIAGLAASIISAGATVFGALLAMPTSVFFDATELPVVLPVCALSLAAALLTWSIPDRD